MPACYVVNHAKLASEGERNPIMLLLDGEIDELQVELDRSPTNIPDVKQALIDIETTYINASLTEPIDDADAHDPVTIHEAKLSIYWTEWLAAMYEELEGLKAKGVYEEVEHLPPGRRAVGNKWVLHIKRNKDFRITRFKARLVAKGFTQIPSQDFTFTFAPTAHWESIHTLLTLTAIYDWELQQVDVKTAFLNGPLDEEIYMHKPDIMGSRYWHLRKGLYGLKQSGHQWYLDLNSKLKSVGFRRIEPDWSVHIRRGFVERHYHIGLCR